MKDKQELWRQWRRISLSVWLFALILVLVFILVPGEMLRYDLPAISDGEYWRLIGASLIHLSWLHLVLNIAVFVLLVLTFPDYFYTVKWAMRFLMIMLITNVIILIVHYDTAVFAGLSGALHGLVYAVARANIRKLPGQLLLVLLIVKLVLEQLQFDGLAFSLLADYPVFYPGHIIGVLASALVMLLERQLVRKSRSI